VAEGRRAAAVALTVSVLAGAISIVAIATRVNAPSSGSAILNGADAYGAGGVAVGVLPGASTTLVEGDVVVAMAGQATAAWADARVARGQTLEVRVGDVVPFEVLRAGRPTSIGVQLRPFPTLDVLAAAWGTLAFVLSTFGIGAFVFWRRPTIPAAGALLVAGVGAAGSTIPFLFGQDPLDLATGVIAPVWLATSVVYLLLWAGLIDFFLVFPRPLDRIAREPRWRIAPYVAVYGAYGLGLLVAAATARDALAWLGSAVIVSTVPVLMAFAAIPVILALRWRRGPVADRGLLRGLAIVIGFIVVVDLVIWVIPELLGGQALVPWTVSALTGLPFVAFIGAAIVRRQAFDIDLVVSRSLVYGGLTICVLATYVAVAAALGRLLGGSSPFAVSLLATGVAAIVALPLRDVLQRGATRLLYGDRDEPVRAIRRLGQRLEASIDPDTMPRVVVDTVGEALRLPYVALELGGEAPRLAAERGTRPAEVIERPLSFRSRQVGRLVVAARGPADPLSAADLRLLDDLTRQVGTAAHAVLLTEDLRASRERIVAAREEERRRLRRDLHDGLGPALAAIGMRAEAAASLLDADPAAAERLLAELRGEVATAVADVRRLVDGLRPPAIDDLGLVGAVRLAADRLSANGSPEVSVESDGALEELPAAVEVAAYRIATEAMTNAVRHAGAAHCSVRLVGGSDLTVIVEDDGAGLPPERRDGVGLVSMHERAAELGGECRVEGGPGGGTTVFARLPLVDVRGAAAS
jgi:signal transduction histidine kinase